MFRLLLILLLLASPASAQQVLLTAVAGDARIVLADGALPARFRAPLPALERALVWRTLQDGLELAELQLGAGRVHVPVRAVIARIDPRRFELSLALVTQKNGMTGAWTVDSAGPDVALAVNAGQFKETGPWGWLLLDGYERRDPGFGPLSAGFAIDTAGAVHWFVPDRLAEARRDRTLRWAFQSYPLLLFDDVVPALLRTSKDLDRSHRDARLILAEQRDGKLLVLLTRYDALGAFAQRVPIGLTVPESVALIGALGARRALMLDGGISGQLALRSSDGEKYIWKGLRAVPLALLARPRNR